MLWNTLIRYSTQQHSAQLEMKEQEHRGDEAEKTSFFVDKYLVSVGEKVVQSLSLSNRETDESRTSKKTIKLSQSEEKKRVYFQS